MKIYIAVFLLMILGHLIADYPLQGWLAQAKHREYWQRASSKYKYDYLAALAGHSTMWGIIVFLPVLYFWGDYLHWYQYLNLVQLICFHFVIDDLKANRGKINLIQDQFFHFCQICLAYLGCFTVIPAE